MRASKRPTPGIYISFVVSALLASTPGRVWASNCQPSPIDPSTTICDCGASGPNQDPCFIFIKSPQADTTVFTIDQPIVDGQAEFGFSYPDIVLQPGDLVTLSASGCVQTGGIGATTKQYDNPDPFNGTPGNSLYWGWFSIPSTPPSVMLPGDVAISQQPFYGVTGSVVVPLNAAPTSLIVGYVDNAGDYDDNGYYSFDNGDGNQCENANPAQVVVTAVHNSSVVVVPDPTQFFDVDAPTSSSFDANAFVQNPVWRWQSEGKDIDGSEATQIDATDQPRSVDPASGYKTIQPFCNGGAPPDGHLNWSASDVTYDGYAFWNSHSSGLFGDDDYNIQIQTPVVNKAACTTAADGTITNINSAGCYLAGATHDCDEASDDPWKMINIEFDSDETVDNFDANDTWLGLHGDVDHGDDTARNDLDGHRIVVSGVLGLDSIHGIPTEVHPAHSFAVDLDCAPTVQRWLFFIRNWGNEGFCSSLDHLVLTQTMTLDLPPPENLPPDAIASTPIFDQVISASAATPAVQAGFSPDQVLHLQVQLGDATDHNFVAGVVTVVWNTSTPYATPECNLTGLGQDPELADDLFDQLGIDPTDTQVALYSALRNAVYTRPSVTTHAVGVNYGSTPPRASAAPALGTQPATAMLLRDSAELSALCATLGGNISASPTLCHNVAPVTLSNSSGARREATGGRRLR